MQAVGNDDRSLSAVVAVGYRLSPGVLTLAPEAGLNGSDMEIDDFIDPARARISLEDGDTLARGARRLGGPLGRLTLYA